MMEFLIYPLNTCGNVRSFFFKEEDNRIASSDLFAQCQVWEIGVIRFVTNHSKQNPHDIQSFFS